MKPVDKFGDPIPPEAFSRLQAIAHLLESYGYKEAASKPGLYLRPVADGTFFADMQGTKEVRIGQFPLPMLYWKCSTSNEVALRMAWIEVNRMHDVPLRLSTQATWLRSSPTGRNIMVDLDGRERDYMAGFRKRP